MKKLISHWNNAPSDSEARKLIEQRIAEVIQEITKDNIPSWFVEVLKGNIVISEPLQGMFRQAVERLKGELKPS